MIFGKPILLINLLGVHQSQNVFVSMGRKGLTMFVGFLMIYYDLFYVGSL